MPGGYGKTRWGFGPWGSEETPTSPTHSFFDPDIYRVPFGRKFGRASILKFTGEPKSGPLSGSNGLLFFSSALLEPNSSNSVDFAVLDFSRYCTDTYDRPLERSTRLFRFGGGPGCVAGSWPSLTNSPLYRTQPIEYTAVATLVQTTPPGPTTVFKIP